MSLQLSEPTARYEAFEGRNIDAMPKLIKSGRVPLSVSGLMRRRLEVVNASEKVRESWLNNYFDTGDGSARRKDGRLKIALDAQPRELTPETKLVAGALPQSEKVYKQLFGVELTAEEVEKYTGNSFTKQEVIDNRIWRVLARHPDEVPKELAYDPNLLKETVDLVFTTGNFDKAMGIYLTSPENAMRLWLVGSLGYGSNATGCDGLGSDCGRLVGVAPEAQESATLVQPLESRILKELDAQRAFTHNGTIYVPVASKNVALKKR